MKTTKRRNFSIKRKCYNLIIDNKRIETRSTIYQIQIMNQNPDKAKFYGCWKIVNRPYLFNQIRSNLYSIWGKAKKQNLIFDSPIEKEQGTEKSDSEPSQIRKWWHHITINSTP